MQKTLQVRKKNMSEELESMVKMALRAGGASPEQSRRTLSALASEAPKNERLIKTREVSKIWECHPKSVLRYAARGLIDPVRRSKRCLRWKLSDVERIAQEGI